MAVLIAMRAWHKSFGITGEEYMEIRSEGRREGGLLGRREITRDGETKGDT